MSLSLFSQAKHGKRSPALPPCQAKWSSAGREVLGAPGADHARSRRAGAVDSRVRTARFLVARSGPATNRSSLRPWSAGRPYRGPSRRSWRTSENVPANRPVLARLENRYAPRGVSWVRIPPPPPVQAPKTEASTGSQKVGEAPGDRCCGYPAPRHGRVEVNDSERG